MGIYTYEGNGAKDGILVLLFLATYGIYTDFRVIYDILGYW